MLQSSLIPCLWRVKHLRPWSRFQPWDAFHSTTWSCPKVLIPEFPLSFSSIHWRCSTVYTQRSTALHRFGMQNEVWNKHPGRARDQPPLSWAPALQVDLAHLANGEGRACAVHFGPYYTVDHYITIGISCWHSEITTPNLRHKMICVCVFVSKWAKQKNEQFNKERNDPPSHIRLCLPSCPCKKRKPFWDTLQFPFTLATHWIYCNKYSYVDHGCLCFFKHRKSQLWGSPPSQAPTWTILTCIYIHIYHTLYLIINYIYIAY